MATATQNGKNWENMLWHYFSKFPGFRKDIFQINLSLDDLKNIDSKDGKNKSNREYKESLKADFLSDNDKMSGMTCTSALRGDIYCEPLGIITDIKNYSSVLGTMKMKDLNLEDYINGIDSNIRYFLFYQLYRFDFLDEHLENVKLLKDFLFSKNKNIEWYKNDFMPIYSDNTTVSYMTPSNFASLFCFNECGYAWEYARVNQIKGFLSKVEDTVEFKIVDFVNNIKSSFVEVKLHIDDKGYIYFNFYDGDECIYILSQRGWHNKKSKEFASNCSFINKNYMTLVSKVEIPKE